MIEFRIWNKGQSQTKIKMNILFQFKLITIMASAITTTQLIAQNPTSKVTQKLTEGNLAPDFSAKDSNGDLITLSSFKGKKVLLSFYRNVGCPVCNFRFHELQKESAFLKENNIVLISIYESTQENLRKYLMDDRFYSIMISDNEEQLYTLYKVDRSYGKIIRGMINGAIGKLNQGKKLFKKPISQDGNTNRIGADFLMDENRKIIISHYHKYLGDDLPFQRIKEVILVKE